MNGNIRRRGGTWTVTWELGPQPAQRCKACGGRYWITARPLEACPKCGGELEETSERRQKTKGGFQRRKGKNPQTDAEAFLHKTIENMSNGTYVEPSKLTLGEYLRKMWLPSLENGMIRRTTLVSYRVHVENHLTPRLGATPLQNLNRQVIAAHYAWLAKEGRTPRRKVKVEKPSKRKRKTEKKPVELPPVNTALSPTTVRRVHATLHRAMRDAVRDNLLPRNPADNVEFPKAEKHDAVLHAWDSKQLRTFLDSAEDDRLRPLWALYAYTGTRRGELLGLTWEDVDLKAATVTIRRGLVPVGYTVAISEPKTNAGRRTIPIPPSVVAMLERHKAAQNAEKMAHRDVWGKGRPEEVRELNLVFTNEVGRELHPDRVSKLFEYAVAKSKLPRISLHGLRHTYATIRLIELKHPVSAVSRCLGHSKTSVTLDVYTHAMPSDDVAGSDEFAALVMPEGL